VHKRSGRARAARAEFELLRAGGGGGHLLRGPPLRLPGVRRNLPRRPGLLRLGQPRPRPRRSGVPRRLHTPGRQGGRGGKRREERDVRRALRLADVLRRSEPVHGAPDGPPGAGADGQDLAQTAPRAFGAAGFCHPLAALRLRGPEGQGPRRFRALLGPDRPPQASAVAARARPPLRPGPTEGHKPGRYEGRQRVRPPYFGGV
ncbi:MAG: hypothetical protein AVDCRST_MAG55-1025, partial [uncultured Rubrobacteraceae bacterium]